MSLRPVTAPEIEPVTIDDALAQLRIEQEADFAYPQNLTYIESLIVIARKHAESILNRALITQTWDLYLDCFPAGDIVIPKAPLQSVSSLQYKDRDGTLQTFDASYYLVDTDPDRGRISLAYGQAWPSTYAEIDAVQIRFVCGYGGYDDINESHRAMVLVYLSALYEHRGDDDFDFAKADDLARRLAEDWIPAI